MWNIPTNERLAQIPRLYETEAIETKDKLVYLHFFILSCDWYVIEYDGEDLFFGYAILNGDILNAEWGYVSFSELKSISFHGIEVDCETETFWTPKPVSTIEKIKTNL
jgi:hypothetical protein